MKSCTALIIMVLCIPFLDDGNHLFAQCSQQIQVRDLKLDKPGQGSFVLDVNCSGSFNGQLVRITGIDREIVDTFRGNSQRKFNFSKIALGEESTYRVIVEFEDEQALLCRRKNLDVDFKHDGK